MSEQYQTRLPCTRRPRKGFRERSTADGGRGVAEAGDRPNTAQNTVIYTK